MKYGTYLVGAFEDCEFRFCLPLPEFGYCWWCRLYSDSRLRSFQAVNNEFSDTVVDVDGGVGEYRDNRQQNGIWVVLFWPSHKADFRMVGQRELLGPSHFELRTGNLVSKG